MAEGKYDYLFISGKDQEFRTRSGAVIAHLEHDMLAGAHQYHAHWVPVEPTMIGMKSWDEMGHGPHTHKTPEVMLHIGTDPENPYDLGAEIEFCMGEEMEKHIINTSCAVYLPAEFPHSPWVIRKVTRPFVVVTICQEETHTEKPRPDLIPAEDAAHMMFINQGYDSPERKVIVPEGFEEW